MQVSQSHDVATMINVFTVEPEKQQQLIKTWLKEGKQFEALPGFVAAALHRSLDGHARHQLCAVAEGRGLA